MAILTHLDDARLVRFTNCGHGPPFEQLEEYTSQVRHFLQGYWALGRRRD